MSPEKTCPEQPGQPLGDQWRLEEETKTISHIYHSRHEEDAGLDPQTDKILLRSMQEGLRKGDLV